MFQTHLRTSQVKRDLNNPRYGPVEHTLGKSP